MTASAMRDFRAADSMAASIKPSLTNSRIFSETSSDSRIFSAGGAAAGPEPRASRRGSSLRHEIEFEEAASGVNTKIRIPRLEFCEVCNGTGAKAGTGVVACVTCGGRGQIHYQQGFFTISRTCPDCRGAGQIVRESCPDCRGKGRIERSRNIRSENSAGRGFEYPPAHSGRRRTRRQ